MQNQFGISSGANGNHQLRIFLDPSYPRAHVRPFILPGGRTRPPAPSQFAPLSCPPPLLLDPLDLTNTLFDPQSVQLTNVRQITTPTAEIRNIQTFLMDGVRVQAGHSESLKRIGNKYKPIFVRASLKVHDNPVLPFPQKRMALLPVDNFGLQ